MLKKYLRLLLLLMGVFFLVLVGMVFLPTQQCLELTDYKTQQKIGCFPLEKNQGFVISYTHSVNKGRVKDFYQVYDNQLYITKTRFVSYGAGIPEPEKGENFVAFDDYFEIQDINRHIPVLLVAVGVIANHGVELNNSVIYLKDFIPVQTQVVFTVKKTSALHLGCNNLLKNISTVN